MQVLNSAHEVEALFKAAFVGQSQFVEYLRNLGASTGNSTVASSAPQNIQAIRALQAFQASTEVKLIIVNVKTY